MRLFRSVCILAAAAAAAAVVATPARAQTNNAYIQHQRGMDETFRLDVGAFFQKFSTNLRAGDAFGSAGTEFGLEEAFGAPDSKTTLRVDGMLRLSRHSSFLFGYRTSDRSGSAALQRDISFGDQTYHVGGQVDSRLRVDVGELYYAYALVANGDAEFALLLGVSAFYDRATLTAAGSAGGGPVVVQDESRNLFAPVPAIGATLRYALYPKCFAWGTVKGVTGTASGYHGSMLIWSAGLDLYFTKNIGIGGGYESVRLDFEKLEARQFALHYRTDGPVAYVSIAF